MNWATIQFLLENTVFLLIGLQARGIIEANSKSELAGLRIAGFCAAVLIGVIAISCSGSSARVLSCSAVTRTPVPRPPMVARVGDWLGGFAWGGHPCHSLLIPEDVPFRETLIFAAMVVTAGTLLLQGLTLPVLVRALKLRGPDPARTPCRRPP